MGVSTRISQSGKYLFEDHVALTRTDKRCSGSIVQHTLAVHLCMRQELDSVTDGGAALFAGLLG